MRVVGIPQTDATRPASSERFQRHTAHIAWQSDPQDTACHSASTQVPQASPMGDRRRVVEKEVVFEVLGSTAEAGECYLTVHHYGRRQGQIYSPPTQPDHAALEYLVPKGNEDPASHCRAGMPGQASQGASWPGVPQYV